MLPSEFDAFRTVLSDLCTSVNRPFTDDLVRVFWEDLKWLPLEQVRHQAKALRGSGKTRFVAHDLRPQQQEAKPEDRGPSMQARLVDFVCAQRRLTSRQLVSPWTFLYRGFPGNGLDPKDFRSKPSDNFAVIGVVIPADGNAPALRVMAEDILPHEVRRA